ncbi:MAG: hypothetical protein IPK64_02385 [bacterium]|nr:hypothetical protein [bacterium]
MRIQLKRLFVILSALSTLFTAAPSFAAIAWNTDDIKGSSGSDPVNAASANSAAYYNCCCWNVDSYNCTNLDPMVPNNRA